MSAQITRDQHFPSVCRRCGTVLYEHAAFCPQCGADHPLDKIGLDTRPKARLRVRDPAESRPPVAVKPSPAGVSASGHSPVRPNYLKDSRTPIKHESLFWSLGRRIFSKGLLLACIVLAIGYAAYLLLGEIFKHDDVTGDQSMYSSSGTIAGYPPQQQANAMPPTAETGPRSTTPQFMDVPDSLRAARASLAQNNLSDAKIADNAAITRDADNEDARAIQREIAAREQRRDSALQYADRCASRLAWACVQQQASEALAIDSSNLHAQALMEHAITETGWAPLHSPNSLNTPKKAAEATAAVASSLSTSSVGRTLAQDRNAATAPAVKGSAGAGVPSPASDRDGVDAQERAILQSGWRHAVPPDTTH